MRLHARDERLLDLAGELQVPPDHHVDDAERDDRRLEARGDPFAVLFPM